MVVEIFGMPLSAPCRILHMTCEALGVEYKETNVDLFKGENKTPEFLKVLYLYFLFHIMYYMMILFVMFTKTQYVAR